MGRRRITERVEDAEGLGVFKLKKLRTGVEHGGPPAHWTRATGQRLSRRPEADPRFGMLAVYYRFHSIGERDVALCECADPDAIASLPGTIDSCNGIDHQRIAGGSFQRPRERARDIQK